MFAGKKCYSLRQTSDREQKLLYLGSVVMKVATLPFWKENFRRKSFPGKSFPGKSFPGRSFPGKIFPGKSFPGESFPGRSFPGKSFLRSILWKEEFLEGRVLKRYIFERDYCMKEYTFFTDLDNTLIYSYKHEIGEQKKSVELYQGRWISYMTNETESL